MSLPERADLMHRVLAAEVVACPRGGSATAPSARSNGWKRGRRRKRSQQPAPRNNLDIRGAECRMTSTGDKIRGQCVKATV